MFSKRGREGRGGINSFEESLKTKRSCRGMCNYEGLRNYVVAVNVACFQLAFLSFWRVLFYYRGGGGMVILRSLMELVIKIRLLKVLNLIGWKIFSKVVVIVVDMNIFISWENGNYLKIIIL